MKKKRPILLVGLGAIGSVIFARLSKSKYDIVCLSSVEGSKIIRKKGLIVKLSSDISSQLFNCEIYSLLPEKYVFDKCIISAKSWVNEILIDDVKQNLTSSASILLFQNGIDIEKPFTQENDGWKISRAVTSLAAYRESKNHSIEASIGFTRLGSLKFDDKDELQIWKDLLSEIGLKTAISENINQDIWLKAITNCAISPLTAITGLPNGEILKDSFLNRITRQVIEEVISVIPAELSISFDEAYGMIDDIVYQTANHKSSMLQDVENKSRTEIDMFNGKIVEFAADKGIEVPTNEKLVELVKQIYDDNIPRERIILELRSL